MARPQSDLDSSKKNVTFREFAGVNTQSSRQTIQENEFAWCENVMPIGHGNMRVVPAQSAALITLVGHTCNYMIAANISNVDYMFMFCTDGSLQQVNLSNNALTQAAAGGTFSGSGVMAAQWKNERILIIDPSKGYFSWDTATLVQINSSVAYVTVTTPGSGYTARPNVIFGGPGSGASANAIVGMGNATLSAAGTGYFVGDILTVTGGTYNTPTQLIVTSVGASNAITGFAIRTAGDYTATPAGSPVSVTGGFGTGATFTPTWSVVSVVMTAFGTGYTSAPSVTFSAGTAAATAYVSVSPSTGTSISTYSGRVWIASGRTVSFSAPSSYNDFSTTNAGGSLIVTDETLHSNINQLITANNFLYIFGDSSINVIADVRVTSGITVFSNTNVSASVGTGFPNSISPYYRAIWFANRYGIYALYGSSTQKASSALDGFFTNVNLSNTISTGQFIMYDILCLAFLATYNDPVVGARPVLAVYFDKKWFFASQGGSLSFIANAEPNGTPTLYGTDGTNLYQLFSSTTSNVSHKMISPLWDMGDPLRTKQALKFGMELTSPSQVASISINIDTEYSTQNYNANTSTQLIWYNNSGGLISWVNNVSQPIVWLSVGYVFSRQDVGNVGNYLGITISSSTPQVTYQGFHMQYEIRTPWTSIPF